MVDDSLSDIDSGRVHLNIVADVRYLELVRKRSVFGWQLTAIILTIYFGFILLVAFQRDLLAMPIGGGVTSLGIPIGIGVIASGIFLTGIYVWRANREFDPVMAQLLAEYGE